MNKKIRTDAYIDIRGGRISVLAMPEATYDDLDARTALLEKLAEEQFTLRVERDREIREAHDTPPEQRTSDQRFCVMFTSRPESEVTRTRVRFYASKSFYCRWCGRDAVGDVQIVYCCNHCKEQAVVAQRVPYKPRPKLQANCSFCGETFTKKRADAKFCSVKCRVAAHRKPDL